MKIKEARDILGISQDDLSRIVGTSTPSICRWENLERKGVDLRDVVRVYDSVNNLLTVLVRVSNPLDYNKILPSIDNRIIKKMIKSLSVRDEGFYSQGKSSSEDLNLGKIVLRLDKLEGRVENLEKDKN